MLTYTTEASGEREETSLKWAKLLSVHDSFMHELSQEVITIGSSEGPFSFFLIISNNFVFVIQNV